MENILRLKELLREKGISLKDFAAKTGLSYNYCSEITRGDKFPRPNTILNIATVLDVDIKDLFVSTKDNKTIEEMINDIRRGLDKIESKL